MKQRTATENRGNKQLLFKKKCSESIKQWEQFCVLSHKSICIQHFAITIVYKAAYMQNLYYFII